MQIQTGYISNPFAALSSTDSPASNSGQDQSGKITGVESPAYKAISNKAAMLLSSTKITASESAKILSLLARAKAADANGAAGELNTLINDLKSLDPQMAIKGDSFTKSIPKASPGPEEQNQESTTYKDRSDDVGVSFSYPVAMNQYQASIAVQSHEGEHVVIARAEAMMKNENVQTYVRIHNGYDGHGRLITTGGTTTVITSPKRQVKPLIPEHKINLTA